MGLDVPIKNTVDGKWYVSRTICFVIFNWLSVKCFIDDCTIVYIMKGLFW